MKSWNRILIGCTAILLAFSAQLVAQDKSTGSSAAGKTIIILDASNSMWGQIDGKHKIEIARETIAGMMTTLPGNLELGLMAYGHRREGDCEDIELLIPPGKVDRKQFLDTVMDLLPRGRTPLTDAVEQAANYLGYEDTPSSVILVSDGIETCDRDPCELAGILAAKGIAFKTHVVAFDLTSEEADSIRCLADETGGLFLQAQDATSLKDALEVAVEEVATPPPAPESAKPVASSQPVPQPVMPEEDLSPATLQVPPVVKGGARFEVVWKGPDNPGDYLTIVPKGSKDRVYGNVAYTRNGSPTELLAPIDDGPYEVRYVAGRSRTILGRADTRVETVEATLDVPAEVLAGAPFEAGWDGPDNDGDYITIVMKGTDDSDYGNYRYTKYGNPTKLRSLENEGAAEVRYVSGQKRRVLARAEITILPAEATVRPPEIVGAGAEFEVTWSGPSNRGDYITIVETRAAEGKYLNYDYTRNSAGTKVAKITAPEVSGEFEVRYVTGQDKKTLASAPVEVKVVTATVKAPEKVTAGSEFEVEWTGPANRSDYITVVEKGAPPSAYANYAYTRNNEGKPANIRAAETAGEYEVRYITGGDKKVLATTSITVAGADATLKAAARAPAGAQVSVDWKGPGNSGDRLVIVAKDAPDNTLKFYTYTRNAKNPVEVEAPETPGECEVRYVTGRDRKVLVRIPIEIEKVSASISSPAEMVAGQKAGITFTGPANKIDRICIVPPDAPAGRIANYIYAKNGSPQQIRAPKEPGNYEIRYVTGRDHNILAKESVTVVAE